MNLIDLWIDRLLKFFVANVVVVFFITKKDFIVKINFLKIFVDNFCDDFRLCF